MTIRRAASGFAENLRTLREERRLSARALAKKAGISPSRVIAIETGVSRPRFETLEKIAAALNIPTFSLYAKNLDVMRGMLAGSAQPSAPRPVTFMVLALEPSTSHVKGHLFTDAVLAVRCADRYRAAGWKATVCEEPITSELPEVE